MTSLTPKDPSARRRLRAAAAKSLTSTRCEPANLSSELLHIMPLRSPVSREALLN